VGVLLGLVGAEALAWLRDDGAFPHINVLTEDATLGVRMVPDSRQRIKLGDNPTAPFTINAQGYRGDDWGEPRKDEIVVVGDSQVFGLGVDDTETTPAQLSALTGRPVLNLGVPTYGPHEYLLALEEVLDARSPETAIIVLNFANDLFELGLPNTTRHRVWDGWAVRIENAPEQVTAFPGRRWLMSQSHAVYALRRWRNQAAEAPDTQGLPSEGDWSTVLTHTLSERATDGKGSSPDAATLVAQISAAVQQREDAEEYQLTHGRQALSLSQEDRLALKAIERRARPGDIVQEELMEEARPVEVTAAMLRRGAALRRSLPDQIAAWVREHPDDPRAMELQQLQSEDARLRDELDQLTRAVAEELAASSPFSSFLDTARTLTDAHNTDLIVVALPLDVQVDAEEFRKYGREPVDMSGTLVLLDDLVRSARRAGIRAMSAVSPLQAAQPGAFLDGDIHLTPDGHRALATAIAEILPAPTLLPQPTTPLPEGRSRVPLPIEWSAVEENLVRGSTKNACVTRQVREWQRVRCQKPGHGRWAPLGAAVVSGPAEAMISIGGGQVDLITPITAGHDQLIDFYWSDRVERLSLRWEDGVLSRAFVAATAPSPAPPPPTSEADETLETCLVSAGLTAEASFGDASAGCAASYPDDCAALIACAQGTREHLPTCPEGQAATGPAGHCRTLCDEEHPCASGICTMWGGGGACL
jgi:hypothetical protein